MNTMLPLLRKSFSIAKKVFIVIAVYFVVLNLFFYLTAKDKVKNIDPIERNRTEIYKTLQNPQLNNTEKGRQLKMIYRTMACQIMGEACTDNPADAEEDYKRSLLGGATSLFTLPFTNPPASGVYWVYSSLQDSGFAPKAYAAEGIGFAALRPFLGIWKVFRNLAYIILVLILITIGFLIMFRVKINPQTIISVENALPRIIVTLLLITFSFPLAGFMIDLMYLSLVLIISQLSTINVGFLKPANELDLINKYSGAGFWQIFPISYPFFDIGNSLVNILPESINKTFRTLFGFFGATFFLNWFYNSFLNAAVESVSKIGISAGGTLLGFGGEAGANIGDLPKLFSIPLRIGMLILFYNFVTPFLLALIVFLSVIFLMFRVFFLLLSAYVKILLFVIFSPIILLLEAIPGQKMFSYWIRNLGLNLLTFPLVLLFVLVSYFIPQVMLDNSSKLWSPPFLYGFSAESFATLVGLAIFLLIPNFIKFIQEKLGLKPSPIPVGPGVFLSGLAGVGGGALGGATKLGSLGYQMNYLGSIPIIGGPIANALKGIGGGKEKGLGPMHGPPRPK